MCSAWYLISIQPSAKMVAKETKSVYECKTKDSHQIMVGANNISALQMEALKRGKDELS